MRTTKGGRVAYFGLLLAAALVLHAVERFIPQPFPFARLGLANVVTVIALLTLGFRDALLLTILRVLLASLIVGTFLGPTFALSAAGGIAAVLAMGAARKVAFPPLGVAGLSMLGAAAHNVAQLGVVGSLYLGWSAAWRLLPAALLLAAVAGLVTGLVAFLALGRMGSFDLEKARPAGA